MTWRDVYQQGKPWPLFLACVIGPQVIIYGTLCLAFGVPS